MNFDPDDRHHYTRSVSDIMKDYLNEGAPVRDTVINGDDIQNLQIALNTCKTMEDFLSQV